jgi:hypothetical protein
VEAENGVSPSSLHIFSLLPRLASTLYIQSKKNMMATGLTCLKLLALTVIVAFPASRVCVKDVSPAAAELYSPDQYFFPCRFRLSRLSSVVARVACEKRSAGCCLLLLRLLRGCWVRLLLVGQGLIHYTTTINPAPRWCF